MNSKTLRLVNSALFAALTCVATMCIHIPTPGTGGYIHPGDALVILSGIVLGSLYGGLAAGIGSALADMLFGYYLYVPVTFIIKFAVAFLSAVIYRKLRDHGTGKTFACIVCGAAATVVVAGGYLSFELLIYGRGAIASLPANIIQGISGLVLATLLLPAVTKVPVLQQGGLEA